LPAIARIPGVAVCTRDGRGWRIDLAGRSAVVGDSVGIRQLATLIAHPGVEIPAIDLATPNGQHGSSDAVHTVLDGVALRQYRQRLRELEDELAQAESQHDIERVTRLRLEADWVADELQAATGLSGRVRSFANNPERARIAVGKAIRRALGSISAADPILGDVLRAAVQTGMRCCYRPAE